MHEPIFWSSPSLYDNAPMVVREAAALNTPSLLIRGSSAAEVVQDGENGLLAENTTEDVAARLPGLSIIPGRYRLSAKKPARQSRNIGMWSSPKYWLDTKS